MNKIKSYKDLIVWQKSIELTTEIYKIINQFPKSEIYGLASQMRRASISISSNIAEGSRRSSKKDFRNFLLISFASASELETQIIISKKIYLVLSDLFKLIDQLLIEVSKMLNTMTANMKPQ